MAWDVGDPVPLAVVVRDMDGNPVNAATISIRVTRPDLSVVEPPIANPPSNTGRYRADFIAEQPGRHTWRAEATDPHVAYEDSFDVRPLGATGLISLRDAKRMLRIRDQDTNEDDAVRQAIEAATLAAENVINRKILRQTVRETVRVTGPRHTFPLAWSPVQQVVGMVNADTGVERDPADIDPDEHGLCTVLRGGPVMGRWRVTYIAGYTVVPAHYREAIEHIVQHLFDNRRGRAGAARVGGGETDAGDRPSGMHYSIPARALDLLGVPGPLVG